MFSQRDGEPISRAGSGRTPILTIDYYTEGILNVQHFRRKHLHSENDHDMLYDALVMLATCKKIYLIGDALGLNLVQWYFQKRGSICSGPFNVWQRGGIETQSYR